MTRPRHVVVRQPVVVQQPMVVQQPVIVQKKVIQQPVVVQQQSPNQQVQVQCPQDGYPGKQITIRAPDGRQYNVTVPQGVAPGGMFIVSIPIAPVLPTAQVTS